jgi:hypothetical protein
MNLLNFIIGFYGEQFLLIYIYIYIYKPWLNFEYK